MSKNLNGLLKFAAAAVIYAGFAVYLYQPHFKNFDRLQYLLVVNVSLASLGCFVLSRRWVASFAGSFFAGAIYGFGPFSLGLTGYHPLAGLLAATVPWLFCPAAFVAKDRWRWLSVPLSTLPFLAILFFFQVTTHYRLFVIPTQSKLHFADLAGLLAPLVMAGRTASLLGFYHIPIAALVMGASMLFAARRFGVMAIFALGAILAFCKSFFNVSPFIWLAIPVVYCSVLVGAGMQALASASSADRKWVLLTAVIMAVLAIVTLLLAPLEVRTEAAPVPIGNSLLTGLAIKYSPVFAGLAAGYAKLFVQTAVMYILGAIAAAIIFFMARAKLRLQPLRWAVLCSAVAIDIFFSATFIVDRIL